MSLTPLEIRTSAANNFRTLLQKEFVRRCQRNQAYSMRAFAKFLEIDQSLLSKIMRYQRKITVRQISKLGSRLGLSPARMRELADISAVGSGTDSNTLADDEFNMISEWQHFAILELSRTKGFRPDITLLARRLGLRVDEVRAAVDRLRRLGLVQGTERRWRLSGRNHTWSNNELTTPARRQLQKSLLEKSLEAIESVPFQWRDHGSLTVAVSRKRLPELKESLRRIRFEFDQLCQQDESPDEVYQLTLSFFPLTQFEGDLK